MSISNDMVKTAQEIMRMTFKAKGIVRPSLDQFIECSLAVSNMLTRDMKDMKALQSALVRQMVTITVEEK